LNNGKVLHEKVGYQGIDG